MAAPPLAPVLESKGPTTAPERPVVALDPAVSQALQGLVDQAVQTLLKAPKGRQVELELRIGRPRSLNRQDKRWLFDSSIDQWHFDYLKAHLDLDIASPVQMGFQSGPATEHTISEVLTKDVDQDSRLRRIATQYEHEEYQPFGPPTITTTESIIYQRKAGLGSVDQVILAAPLTGIPTPERNVYMLRFALATEDEEQPNPSGGQGKLETQFAQSPAPTIMRRRERWSYPLKGYGTIDLTIVDGKEYSVEFEYNRATLEAINKTGAIKDRKTLFGSYIGPPLKYLARLLWPELPVLMGISEVTETYFKLLDISTGGARLTPLRPQNIAEEEVPNLLSGYAVTNKLNGTQYRLMIDYFRQSGSRMPMAYLVSGTELRFLGPVPPDLATKLRLTDPTEKTESGSLIDVELFIPTDAETIAEPPHRDPVHAEELHAWDCPVFQGRSLTLESHEVRLRPVSVITRYLDQFLRQHGYRFEVKHFEYSGDILLDLVNITRYMYGRYGVNTERDNDGLVFQPVGRTRDGKAKAYYDRFWVVYKWKWSDAVSIDFVLEEILGFDRDGIAYRVFTLLVSDQRKLVPFLPFNRGGRFYNPPAVLIVPRDDARSAPIRSGLVAELGFDRLSNSFVLLRMRDDKIEPNTLNTAQLTFVDMYVEFGLDRLRSLLEQALGPKAKPTGAPKAPGAFKPVEPAPKPVAPLPLPAPGPKAVPVKAPTPCLVNYRAYHNRVKTGVIQAYTFGKRVADLGGGKGGDLWKFNEAETAYLWSIEPNTEFIDGPDGFMDRLLNKVATRSQKDKQWVTHVQVIRAGAEDTKTIAAAMEQTVDVRSPLAEVMTSFFSASFFFKDEDMLKAVARTIGERLEVGGKFVGTMIDGGRLYDELKKGDVKEACYSITRRYDPKTPLGLGMEVSINLDTATVVGDQIEWLSPFDALRQALAAYNVELVEGLFLDDPRVLDKFPRPKDRDPTTQALYARLDPSEKRLNALYRYFVFEKREIKAVDAAKKAAKVLAKERKKNLLDMLARDESEEFTIPLYSDPLYRVGTVGEGSCLYHSLLFLLVNERYISLKLKERKALAAKFRNALADTLTPDMLSKLARGAVEAGSVEVMGHWGYLPFVKAELKEALITNVRTAGEQPDITEAQLSGMIETVAALPTVGAQIDKLQGELVALGYDRDVTGPIIQEGRLRLWEEYRKKLKDCGSYADHDAIEYVMRSIGHNIFIIEDSTRLPVLFSSCDLYDPKRSSLVILLLKSVEHFEAVTNVKTDAEGNVIETTLSWPWESPLIQALYGHLCEVGK